MVPSFDKRHSQWDVFMSQEVRGEWKWKTYSHIVTVGVPNARTVRFLLSHKRRPTTIVLGFVVLKVEGDPKSRKPKAKLLGNKIFRRLVVRVQEVMTCHKDT
jgi:hypothetical protein